jgi:hypothetical protein
LHIFFGWGWTLWEIGPLVWPLGFLIAFFDRKYLNFVVGDYFGHVAGSRKFKLFF